MASFNPNYVVNVPLPKADQDRIVREEETWTAPKLTVLLLGTLAVALVALYFMAASVPYPHPFPYFTWIGPEWRIPSLGF